VFESGPEKLRNPTRLLQRTQAVRPPKDTQGQTLHQKRNAELPDEPHLRRSGIVDASSHPSVDLRGSLLRSPWALTIRTDSGSA
jgi:hypothetical protein